MSEETNLKISIIVVTFNSFPALEQSLISLKKALSQLKSELIIVDNNSTDNSIEIARQLMPDCKVITNNKNVGFSRACNQGAKIAKGEFILFYNPDLSIDSEALKFLLEAYEQSSKPGALAGRMRFPDGEFQATCRRFPSVSNIFFSRGSVLSFFGKGNTTYTLPDYDNVTEVEAVAGTFLMIKKELFEKIGCFDERFFMYMEDTDLCLRLNQAGCLNYFVPQSGGVHLWGKGSSGGRILRSYYHHLSVWKYFLKHYPNGFTIFLLPVMLLLNFILKIFIR